MSEPTERELSELSWRITDFAKDIASYALNRATSLGLNDRALLLSLVTATEKFQLALGKAEGEPDKIAEVVSRMRRNIHKSTP